MPSKRVDEKDRSDIHMYIIYTYMHAPELLMPDKFQALRIGWSFNIYICMYTHTDVYDQLIASYLERLLTARGGRLMITQQRPRDALTLNLIEDQLSMFLNSLY